MEEIAQDIFYAGVNDRNIDFFEGLYKVPNGVSYNSYVILDEKIAIMDTVDGNFGEEWLAKVNRILNGREPDFLIVQHMEPDHSANVALFMEKFPRVKIVGNRKIFVMLSEYFGTDYSERRLVVEDGDKLTLGRHELTFVFAPMVHWPEVMVSYESLTKTLFSADAFGKFGALDCNEEWEGEARRYYYGIVGKYGKQVTAALNKLSALDIREICPLHGPILKENLGYYLGLYRKWAGYEPETDGVMIAYASVYGHTRKAAYRLKDKLKQNGVENVIICDLVRSDRSQNIANAFRFAKLVIASVTYNAELFPPVKEFIDGLTSRNYQNRQIGFMENGTWAPVAAKLMRDKFANCAGITFAQNTVKIKSNLSEESEAQIDALAAELSEK